MNRVTVETNELGLAREFAYDELGDLTRRDDRNGRIVQYDYDRLQRRTEERWLDGGGATTWTIAFSYDAVSQLTGASDLDSAYTYTYDAVGNIEAVEHESALLGKTIRLEQAFDAVGNRLQVLAKIDGVADVVTDQVYDALNRMTRIEQAGAAVPKRVDVAYDAAGQFATIGRFADLAGTQSVAASGYTFDAGGRLTGLAHGTLATYGWTYDAGNRLTQMTSPDGTGDYTYDATDQLVGADYDYQTDEAYAFDANGNRVGTGYVTGANNRTLSDGVYNYAYDAEGNRTLRTHVASGATTEYTWDHRNRLTGIVDKDGAGVVTGSVGYRYDPFNRRTSKVIAPGVGPAELEHFAYDGGIRAADGDRHMVLQFGVSGAVTHRYLHGPAVDQVFADEQVDPGSGAANVLWPLTDHLGSVRDLAEYDDVTGITSIANHIVYGSFGGVMSESNANVDCAFGFTGRETDPESDLNYYRARCSASSSARTPSASTYRILAPPWRTRETCCESTLKRTLSRKARLPGA